MGSVDGHLERFRRISITQHHNRRGFFLLSFIVCLSFVAAVSFFSRWWTSGGEHTRADKQVKDGSIAYIHTLAWRLLWHHPLTSVYMLDKMGVSTFIRRQQSIRPYYLLCCRLFVVKVSVTFSLVMDKWLGSAPPGIREASEMKLMHWTRRKKRYTANSTSHIYIYNS